MQPTRVCMVMRLSRIRSAEPVTHSTTGPRSIAWIADGDRVVPATADPDSSAARACMSEGLMSSNQCCPGVNERFNRGWSRSHGPPSLLAQSSLHCIRLSPGPAPEQPPGRLGGHTRHIGGCECEEQLYPDQDG